MLCNTEDLTARNVLFLLIYPSSFQTTLGVVKKCFSFTSRFEVLQKAFHVFVFFKKNQAALAKLIFYKVV